MSLIFAVLLVEHGIEVFEFVFYWRGERGGRCFCCKQKPSEVLPQR